MCQCFDQFPNTESTGRHGYWKPTRGMDISIYESMYEKGEELPKGLGLDKNWLKTSQNPILKNLTKEYSTILMDL